MLNAFLVFFIFYFLSQTVVLGYFSFNSSPQPPGYKQFFYSSMRVVENGKPVLRIKKVEYVLNLL